ncbi:PAS domain-containing sensor histidine kinase [Flavobacterium amniphilum]|uniref:sensor histidine kinase n=1 Tax=Flavobacterium amniphilum TaxID=1834035 RepID=UPI002029DBF5|nr:ATP-binding protein [Flavobacterium amniphilum]MCL9805358.1 PAS domain-containing sensor histidine kinase [Flavobacterium amniphilum]
MDKLFQKTGLNQYTISVISVVTVSLLCLSFRSMVDYKIIGYLLLVLVSLQAIFLEIKPVVLGAVLSALALDFLFIRPYYNLHIDKAEDAFLLLMFFIIALINAVLTNKFRRMQRAIQIKETRASTLKLYNTLLDSLSHELRTPIAAIIGSIDTLQQKDVNLSEETQEKLHNEIEKASTKLNYQVENLLNMSRLESGYIHPKMDWCDVTEIIYNVCERLSDELKYHKVVYPSDDNLPLFKLDYGLMEQIFHNLVYNFSQHTPKGATISFKVSYDVDVDYDVHIEMIKKCVITITDDGHGFPAAEIDRAFDKFYRFTDSKTGGTGLGLSIVRGFTEAQNGTISLHNTEDGGAVFTLVFNVDALALNTLENE